MEILAMSLKNLTFELTFKRQTFIKWKSISYFFNSWIYFKSILYCTGLICAIYIFIKVFLMVGISKLMSSKKRHKKHKMQIFLSKFTQYPLILLWGIKFLCGKFNSNIQTLLSWLPWHTSSLHSNQLNATAKAVSTYIQRAIIRLKRRSKERIAWY